MKKGLYILLGIGAAVGTVYLSKEALEWFWTKLDYTFGKPSLQVQNTGTGNPANIVFVQPISFISSLPFKIHILKYEGAIYYKDEYIGDALMNQVVIRPDEAVATEIKTTFAQNVGSLASMTIKDPYEIVRIIQQGMVIKGKLHLSLKGLVVKIPISDIIKF